MCFTMGKTPLPLLRSTLANKHCYPWTALIWRCCGRHSVLMRALWKSATSRLKSGKRFSHANQVDRAGAAHLCCTHRKKAAPLPDCRSNSLPALLQENDVRTVAGGRTKVSRSAQGNTVIRSVGCGCAARQRLGVEAGHHPDDAMNAWSKRTGQAERHFLCRRLKWARQGSSLAPRRGCQSFVARNYLQSRVATPTSPMQPALRGGRLAELPIRERRRARRLESCQRTAATHSTSKVMFQDQEVL